MMANDKGENRRAWHSSGRYELFTSQNLVIAALSSCCSVAGQPSRDRSGAGTFLARVVHAPTAGTTARQPHLIRFTNRSRECASNDPPSRITAPSWRTPSIGVLPQRARRDSLRRRTGRRTATTSSASARPATPDPLGQFCSTRPGGHPTVAARIRFSRHVMTPSDVGTLLSRHRAFDAEPPVSRRGRPSRAKVRPYTI